MKTAKIATNIALAVLTIAAVGLGLGVHYGHVNAQPVLSGSMRPVAQPGDLVFVKSTPTASLHVGEVIALYPPGVTGGAPYMHRIVTLSRAGSVTTITTRGDANNVADPWGKVALRNATTDRLVYVVPKMGFVSVWVHNIVHNTRSLVLILAGCLVLILGAYRLPWGKGDHARDRHAVKKEEVVS